MSTERVAPDTHGKQRVKDALFVWKCQICSVPIGVVKQTGVQIRYKGLVVEGAFPVLRKCVECQTVNRITAGNKESTSIVTIDTSSA